MRRGTPSSPIVCLHAALPSTRIFSVDLTPFLRPYYAVFTPLLRPYYALFTPLLRRYYALTTPFFRPYYALTTPFLRPYYALTTPFLRPRPSDGKVRAVVAAVKKARGNSKRKRNKMDQVKSAAVVMQVNITPIHTHM